MADYHRLGIKEKRTRTREAMREPPVRCPRCGLGIEPRDLLRHVEERCQGAPEPHRHARWLSWGEALAEGVGKSTLSYWVRFGAVRVSEGENGRLYLHRDVVMQVEHLRCKKLNRRKRVLTSCGRKDRNLGMRSDKPLDDETRERLRALAHELGGVDATSRRLDIPARTLGNALAGKPMRRGTRTLIEAELGRVEGESQEASHEA